MDVSDYLPMFLAEAREHLQELNLAVVRIEEAPEDSATVDEIFRIAHSLKGMSATMGFAAMAALTHEMEDVFELLRQRRTALSKDAVDVLLACLDALEGALDSVEADGSERLDHAPLAERLRALVRERTPEQEVERQGGAPAPGEVAFRADGRHVLHVSAVLAEGVSMASVRAFMVLGALGECGEILGSTPKAEAVEQFDGRTVEAWMVPTASEQTIVERLKRVPEVDNVELTVEEPAPQPAADAAAAEAAPAARPAKGAATVRVDAERLDQLMHVMGELVVHRTYLESLVAQASGVPGLGEAMQDVTRASQSLQAMVMQVRMIPVEAVFLRFPRLVRDLSTKLGKQVDLQLVGKDTELDRTVVDALGDPLVHLVRNALDHGLEPPEERVAAGKPATGTLEIAARHAGGNVVIEVRDDGRGIDPAEVAEIAVERGIIPAEQGAGVDMARAVELLFTPGFSTARQTSDISGRGVGMDAVRAQVRALGGDVVMQSRPGQGTTAQIRLPLTLAIVAALLVEAGGLPFGIPLDRIERTLLVGEATVRSVAGRRVLALEDGVLPLLDASVSLGAPESGTEDGLQYAVLVHAAGGRVALAVDRLVGQRELVTRPLPPQLERRGASGGAVLADGQIALIVDCDALGAQAGPARVPA